MILHTGTEGSATINSHPESYKILAWFLNSWFNSRDSLLILVYQIRIYISHDNILQNLTEIIVEVWFLIPELHRFRQWLPLDFWSHRCDLELWRTLNWNSKTAAEDKNTRVNNTVKNRVHVGYMLSLDDGYYTAGCLRRKFFMNQVNHLPVNCLLNTYHYNWSWWCVLKSWNRPIHEKWK